MKFTGLSQQFYRFIAGERSPNGRPYLLSKPQTEKHLHDAARLYVRDMMGNPEYYVACPDEHSLDFSYVLKADDGRDLVALDDVALLESFLEHDDEKLQLWMAWYNGEFSPIKKEEAQKIVVYRSQQLSQSASRLLSSLSFNAMVAAQIMYFISKYCVKFDASGALNFIKIKKTNRHHLITITDKLLLCILQCMHSSKSVKQACIQGIRLYYSRRSKNVYASGWIEFSQSESMVDAERLKQACAGAPWCIANCLVTSKSYLSKGSFYIYFDMGEAVVAVHDGDEITVEGVEGSSRRVGELYEHEVAIFLVKQGLYDGRGNIFEGGEFVGLAEQEKCFDMPERDLIREVLCSIRAKNLSDALLQKVDVYADKHMAHLNKVEFGRFKLSGAMHKRLSNFVSMKAMLQEHEDRSITVHGNMSIEGNRSILHRVVEIKGSLKLFGEHGIELPCLQRIGGHLDVRHASKLHFPALKYVEGVLDASGASCLSFPKLMTVRGELVGLKNEINAPVLKLPLHDKYNPAYFYIWG